MSLFQIAVLTLLAALAGRIPRGRQLVLLAISVAALFWLQGPEPFPTLRFWIPVATIAVTALSWAVTASPEVRGWRMNFHAALVVAGSVGAIAAVGRLPLDKLRSPGTPSLEIVLLGLVILAVVSTLLVQWQRSGSFWRVAAIIGIISVFVILKSPSGMQVIMNTLVSVRGVNPVGEPAVIAWLGFSYLAFRLLHTIRDRQAGRLPPVSLSEYMNYAIFFPAFTSGPIDRVERFVTGLRQPLPLGPEDWIYSGRRLLFGLFKKFVIADLLAVISINTPLVERTQAGGMLWLFLYAYAFRIYFDFSGYTDIAIGMGRLLGVRLPENFESPYLKPNLTLFWNAWHISLTQWFRAYVFNPLARALRQRDLPAWLVILATQLTTMLLIGLWHGITWGFAAWGLWHGAGLFLHNRWAEFSRTRGPAWAQTAWGQRLSKGAGVFLTFNYVALGWLFFTLSEPRLAWAAMARLFGIT